MNVLRFVWSLVSPEPPPLRPEIVLAVKELEPAVESEIGRSMKPKRPVRHHLKLVDADWWRRTYAPDHKRSA